jgi:ADP-heptose:LPS heptosyltransferase
MKKTFIQLGRIGDLINLLPLCEEGVRVVSCNEFSSILDGVSYVEQIPVRFKCHELARACNFIKGPKIVTQVFMNPNTQGRKLLDGHFTATSWRFAGEEKWEDRIIKFDRRNAHREWKLLREYGFSRLIFNLEAHSSPLGAQKLEIEKRLLAMGGLKLPKAERIYDLLCFYERAQVLVSTDTASLHLAAAVGVPTIAILPLERSYFCPNERGFWRAKMDYRYVNADLMEQAVRKELK